MSGLTVAGEALLRDIHRLGYTHPDTEARIAVIEAAAIARVLTVDRVAAALAEVDGEDEAYLTKFPAVRDAHREYATAIIAALTGDQG